MKKSRKKRKASAGQRDVRPRLTAYGRALMLGEEPPGPIQPVWYIPKGGKSIDEAFKELREGVCTECARRKKHR